MKFSRRKWITIGAVLIAAATLFLFTSPGYRFLIYPLSVNESLEKSAAIIILGGGLEPGGGLNLQDVERTREGIKLWQGSYASFMIFSGGEYGDSGFFESREMAKMAEGLGVPEGAVILEENSRNTLENAAYSEKIMRDRGWQSALLVTSDFHSRRACKFFRARNMDIVCVGARSDMAGRTLAQKLAAPV